MSMDPHIILQPGTGALATSRAMPTADVLAKSDASAPTSGQADDNDAHADGASCSRCRRPIEKGDGARRRADTGEWLHAVCPPDRPDRECAR